MLYLFAQEQIWVVEGPSSRFLVEGSTAFLLRSPSEHEQTRAGFDRLAGSLAPVATTTVWLGSEEAVGNTSWS